MFFIDVLLIIVDASFEIHITDTILLYDLLGSWLS